MNQETRLVGRRKVYVASSWRNVAQPGVVAAIRSLGHEVYDFRNPSNGGPDPFDGMLDGGFSWRDIDEQWQSWDGHQYINNLSHPLAEAGYRADFGAMEWADTFVLVQPCGRSAHLELGWAVGQGKTTVMMLDEQIEPELMVKMCDHICVGLGDVLELFEMLKR